MKQKKTNLIVSLKEFLKNKKVSKLLEHLRDSHLDKVIKHIKEKINPNFNGTLTKRKTINRIKDGNISF
ncbi:hypothetical protein K6L59_01435, partial [Candidatus Phytoplasma sp. Tabriz.2]|nr:hypothetical protein [Candidatus Phytoplasma australiense]